MTKDRAKPEKPDEQGENKTFSPREFLRARRPEKFSDSIQEQTPALDRSILEYHLATLTSRGQETDFEHFARKLAEHEVCPNLLPQTGPTGGGDSKVDSETYPVADSLAFAWFGGIGREAAAERWAFAFSAKKDWRSKVQSDVAKLAGTSRGYSKAFFITNQYVTDRVRAEVEDSLSKAHGMDVRILDLSWILDRVFAKHHEEMAIDQLKMTVDVRRQTVKGPLDTQRDRDLKEIESRIARNSQESRFGIQYVSDCVEAGELSRSLDLPRDETDGRFVRARRAAEEYGDDHQKLVAAYQHAWTTYWWYEDHESFADLYSEVEKHAKGSHNSHDLELLTNLWMILHASVHKGDIDESRCQISSRTEVLTTELERLSQEGERPSAALQARTLRLQMRLAEAIAGKDKDKIDSTLKDLGDVVLHCEGLLGFPLDPLVEILSELNDFLGDLSSYDELFETIIDVSSRRDGELSAARLLCRRGAGQLMAEKPYAAIRTIGRALAQLYKHESRHELVNALCLCGCAYEHVGLLWAARGSFLTAASVATNEFWTYADVTPSQASCYNRLKWLELQLGRIPHALAWHEIDGCVRSVLADKGYDPERLLRGEMEFAAILGILFLRADAWQLKQLCDLPDVLDDFGLETSATALRFALGYIEDVPKALTGESQDEKSLHEFFASWRDQPASEDIATRPILCEGSRVEFHSHLLGCSIAAECDNTPPCVELAESLLAGLESLLATIPFESAGAREPVLLLNIKKSDFSKKPFAFELSEPDGIARIEMQCSDFSPHQMSRDEYGEIRKKVFEVLALAMARVFLHGESEDLLTSLFRDERAGERATNFTSSFVTLGNVLGHGPKTNIGDWSRADARKWPLKRWVEWDADDRRKAQEQEQSESIEAIKYAKGDSPFEIDKVFIKHTEIKTYSLIREVLWNQAKWSGTVFLHDEKDASPSIMAFLFRDGVAAKKIFENWREEIGAQDREAKLRISIIRHVDREEPHKYRIVVGMNPNVITVDPKVKRTIMISRINTMTPSSDQNLTLFLERCRRFGFYFLAYAVMDESESKPKEFLDLCIGKRDLFEREAWEIGRNDPDGMGIQEDDDPIIPGNITNAPVTELLKWRRERTGG